MGAPEHWRLRKKRYQLTGFIRLNGNGPEVSLSGSPGSWRTLENNQSSLETSQTDTPIQINLHQRIPAVG